MPNPSEEAVVETYVVEPTAEFPNNAGLPVLVYRAACRLPAHGDAANVLQERFARNRWSGGWRNGVYNYHHYHSTSHEVLGCYAGRASLQLGGPSGIHVEFARADVLVLPAGVAHKSLETSHDFSVVGAYPHGVPYDMQRAGSNDAAAQQRIARVPLPERDPVYGAEGPLLQHWRAR